MNTSILHLNSKFDDEFYPTYLRLSRIEIAITN